MKRKTGEKKSLKLKLKDRSELSGLWRWPWLRALVAPKMAQVRFSAHGDSQSSATSVPADPTPSSDLFGHWIHMMYIPSFRLIRTHELKTNISLQDELLLAHDVKILKTFTATSVYTSRIQRTCVYVAKLS